MPPDAASVHLLPGAFQAPKAKGNPLQPEGGERCLAWTPCPQSSFPFALCPLELHSSAALPAAPGFSLGLRKCSFFSVENGDQNIFRFYFDGLSDLPFARRSYLCLASILGSSDSNILPRLVYSESFYRTLCYAFVSRNSAPPCRL